MKPTILFLCALLVACGDTGTEPPPPIVFNETYELDRIEGKILPADIVIGTDTVRIWGGVVEFESADSVELARVIEPFGETLRFDTRWASYERTGSRIVFSYGATSDTGTISQSEILVRETVRMGGVQRVILARYLKR